MGWTALCPGLLRQIPGLELVVLDSQCCGIAGTYQVSNRGELRHVARHWRAAVRQIEEGKWIWW